MSRATLRGLLVGVIVLPIAFALKGADSVGREFYLAFLRTVYGEESGYSMVTVTTNVNGGATVTISTPMSPIDFQDQIFVERHASLDVKIPVEIRGRNTGLAYKSVYVSATDDIAVLGSTYRLYSSGCFTALPVDALGNEYYVMTYTGLPQFILISIAKDTNVKIVFPNNHLPVDVQFRGKRYGRGDTLTLKMNRFHTFICYQDSVNGDFTGTHVTSSKPIAVVCGNMLVTVPAKVTKIKRWKLYGAKEPGEVGTHMDHIAEFALPTHAWGKRFFTFSSGRRFEGDILRIIGTEPKTKVTITRFGGLRTHIFVSAGLFQELNVGAGYLLTIESEHAICVGLFAKSGPIKRHLLSLMGGDPAFTILSPVSQFSSIYTFNTGFGTDMFASSLAIIINENDISGLMVNGKVLRLDSERWIPFPGSSGYSMASLLIEAGSYAILHTNPTKKFWVMAFGVAPVTSYAFNVGTLVAPINKPCTKTPVTVGDLIDNDCDGKIDEEENNYIDDDGDGLADEDLALPPQVHGQWGEWGGYSQCSHLCEKKGKRRRTRECDSPAPAYNGFYCDGRHFEEEVCDASNIPCADWLGWSQWTTCEAECDNGKRKRSRKCVDITQKEVTICAGDNEEVQTCFVPRAPGRCYDAVGGKCSYCEYGFGGHDCSWCSQQFTGCDCKTCRVPDGCPDVCLNGYQIYSGGENMCKCPGNETHGFWQSPRCDMCMDGFMEPQCIFCAPGWAGYTCSLQCGNGGTFNPDQEGEYMTRQKIIPRATCRAIDRYNNTFLWVGYSNFNSRVIDIPVGDTNLVHGAKANSQETTFTPGSHSYAFQIGPIKPGTVVTWKLLYGATNVPYEVVTDVNRVPSCPPRARKLNLLAAKEAAHVGVCECAKGYFGASCEGQCPGGTKSPCFDRGLCRRHDGKCLCQSRFAENNFNYEFYTKGYVSERKGYACQICTKNFIGQDCSTGLVARNFNGSERVAATFSSEMITLDGATATLVQAGAYRLFESSNVIVDGLYLPCFGRHDCHTLREVAIVSGNIEASVEADDEGRTVVKSNFINESYKSDEIKVKIIVDDVIRFIFKNGLNIVIANLYGELMLGLILPKAHPTVYGLLGNADGDWVNDISGMDRFHRYSRVKLTAQTKASWLDTRFRRSLKDTVLRSERVNETMSSAGYAIELVGNSSISFKQLDLQLMSKFSLESWIQIPETFDFEAVLFEIETLGDDPIRVAVHNGMLIWDYKGDRVHTNISLESNVWTYVAMNWRYEIREVTLSATTMINGKHTTQCKTLLGVQMNGTITASSLNLGGGTADQVVRFEYIRFFDSLLVVLFDEGRGPSFFARKKGKPIGNLGTLNGTAWWIFSTVPTEDIITARPLPSTISDSDAVWHCKKELTSTPFRKAQCTRSLGSIHQVVMENCIKDRIRTQHFGIVRLSSSALAHYCQAVTRADPCLFQTYLDFCTKPKPATLTVTTHYEAKKKLILTSIFVSAATLPLMCLLFAALCRKKRGKGEKKYVVKGGQLVEEDQTVQMNLGQMDAGNVKVTADQQITTSAGAHSDIEETENRLEKIDEGGELAEEPEVKYEGLSQGRCACM